MVYLCLRCFLPGTSSFDPITNGDPSPCQIGPAPGYVSAERGRFQQLHCQLERARAGMRQQSNLQNYKINCIHMIVVSLGILLY